MSSDTAQLHIIRTRGDGDSPTVGIIAAAEALCGMPSVDDRVTAADPVGDRIESILAHAAAMSDPVLIVPETPGSEAHLGEPEVTRMLVPIDQTATERRVLRPWIKKALELGMNVEQVHVLTDRTRPAIWEGSGHNAEAWWAALKFRHQTPGAVLSVCSGDPATQVVDKSMDADLVLISWRGGTASGHPAVLRRILRNLRRPVLLIRRAPWSLRPTAGPAAT